MMTRTVGELTNNLRKDFVHCLKFQNDVFFS